jgi:SOS-response transcriptional repressor LexA
LIIRGGEALARPEKRSKQDSSIKGYKALEATSPSKARRLADEIIKNTYRTLMTRGQKGCYIYCTDPETNSWFKSLMRRAEPSYLEAPDRYPNLPLRVLPSWEARPYENCIPIYDLSIAAGIFSDEQVVEDHDWVEMPPEFRIQEGHFVTRVIGESMNRRIPNGSWCLFRANPVGTREGKIVLVQHREINDMDLGGHYTIKLYHSEKVASDEFEWQHRRITLKPDTKSRGYSPIVLEGADLEEFKVLAEFVAVL